ncbi:hypothetical protein OIU74_010205 [Salix koriyanagi]|uniref:Uncharacterized protein n=1 Tax=Salix koriyanagi TaxID=2511006 RepID=A0A9Q0TCJ2_9ROSI|nr:hypothetical protein OIU74_010205 [Salix koriyanagi]
MVCNMTMLQSPFQRFFKWQLLIGIPSRNTSKDKHQEVPTSVVQKYEELMAITHLIEGICRRNHLRGIRRLEKLVNTVDGLESALQLIISKVFVFEEVISVLGASPTRPQQHVHELSFLCGNVVAGRDGGGLSCLISKGAGSGSYPGHFWINQDAV